MASPGAGQGTRDEAQGHLAPAGDEHVLRTGREAADFPHEVGDRRAQAGVPSRVAVPQARAAPPAVRDRRRARATRSTGTRRTSGTPPAMTSVPRGRRRAGTGRDVRRQREVRTARHRLRAQDSVPPRAGAAPGPRRRRTFRLRRARSPSPRRRARCTRRPRCFDSRRGCARGRACRAERRRTADARAARRPRPPARCAGRPARARSPASGPFVPAFPPDQQYCPNWTL